MNSFTHFKDFLRRHLSKITTLWKALSIQYRIYIHDLSEKMRNKIPLKFRLGIGLLFIITILAGGGVLASVVSTEHLRFPPPHKKACLVAPSAWMAQSLISRQQGILTDPSSAAQPLQAGITQKALTAILDRYPENNLIRDYIQRSTRTIAPYLSSASNDVKTWALDRLSNGNAMVQNGSSIYEDALWAMEESIAINPRNDEHGLWYWENYPQWSYLDGMYSFAPFSAISTFKDLNCGNLEKLDACVFNNDTLDDLLLQFTLLWQHCRNETTGLLHHGYDASKKATWANRATGSSSIVWGRSLGWYAMALVDTIELLPANITHAWRRPLLEYYQNLAYSIMQAVDKKTGGWFQVVDQGGREGNYIESSATAMLSYALLKGARLGYVAEKDVESARNISRRAHKYLTDTFVIKEANGTLGWNGTVGVCSLNSTANYEYYINQPIDYNSPFGTGAFILSSVEIESLGGTKWDKNGTICVTI
ncbi:Unsaturated rhamnogalacturonyl hydrolase YteR [Cytospora mali]|uniref:Unsaturated rhamnogalacturonyl hydrolase YteR n=1 Tax=Cytospora mali TaxID=578113 RepID=A0A194W2Z9_CYTMA|nr:Unsaturated rhamnogalacturonyl hydrolase YteR [Valsa mali]